MTYPPKPTPSWWVSICPVGSPLALVPYAMAKVPPLDQFDVPEQPTMFSGGLPAASPGCAATMTGAPFDVVGTTLVSRLHTGGCGSVSDGSVEPAANA